MSRVSRTSAQICSPLSCYIPLHLCILIHIIGPTLICIYTYLHPYIYIYIYIHLTICLGVHSVNTEEIHLGSYMDINIYLQLWSTLYTYVHTYACGIMVIVAGNGHKFKYWRSLFTFYIALIPLGNI